MARMCASSRGALQLRCLVVRPRRRGRPGRRPGPLQLVRLALEGGDAVQRTKVVKSVRAVLQIPLSRLSHNLAAVRSVEGLAVSGLRKHYFLSRYLRFQELVADLLRRPVPVR